jgi:hypothetical protein
MEAYTRVFVQSHSHLVRGACLEIHSDEHIRRYGGKDVRTVDVVDSDPSNGRATVFAGLSDFGSLPEARYDCILLTHVLPTSDTVAAVLKNVWRALAPGGALLISLPAMSPLDDQLEPGLARLAAATFTELLTHTLPTAMCAVVSYGSRATALAAANGVAAEEVLVHEFVDHEPGFSVVLGARVQKPLRA